MQGLGSRYNQGNYQPSYQQGFPQNYSQIFQPYSQLPLGPWQNQRGEIFYSDISIGAENKSQGTELKPNKADLKRRFNGPEAIYVGDIKENVRELLLKEHFKVCGTVMDCYYPKDKNGFFKGYAFIKFSSVEEARMARYKMNHSKILDQEIRVMELLDPRAVNTDGNIIIKDFHNLSSKDIESHFSQYDEIFSVKTDTEKNEAYIQFKTMKKTEILEKMPNKPHPTNPRVLLTNIDGQEVSFEIFQKKGSVYIQNLPFKIADESPEADSLKTELIQLLQGEANHREVLQSKFGKNDSIQKGWGIFKFNTYKLAYEVFETLQGKAWKNSELEIFLKVKTSKNIMKDLDKMITGPIRRNVKEEDLQNFFAGIHESVLISVKYPQIRHDNIHERKLFATVFINKEGNTKVNEFIHTKGAENIHILQQYYDGVTDPKSIVYTTLVPKKVLQEYLDLKKKIKYNKDLNFEAPGKKSRYNATYETDHTKKPPVSNERIQLGEQLYEIIFKNVQDKDLTGKITGMLIDETVFDLEDIKAFIDDPIALKERIEEAVSLINNSD